MPPDLNLPWPVKVALHWFSGQPVVAGLLTLMLIDVFVGIFVAVGKKTLNSTISWRGMSKKAIMLLIVGASGVVQPSLPAVPLLNIVAAFYTLTEALSILENAAALGVPLPAGLVDTLSKLRDQQRMQREQKSPQGPTTTQNINVIMPPPVAPAPPAPESPPRFP